uniref:HTH-type transcriptional regulator SoxR n=1 Tax=Arthrobacter sp. (strain TE1826) TaxID=68999 RepID=SOXR_ARTST|nr:RecName: Full=HTH-type transcriptional regulator SoxR [Arthrobacter sp. TE1826]pir/T44247/ ranscription regulator LysR family homolog [imported] - Arthrobacter sp. (strain TE1826) [Arthrobacter sp.]BAA09717.1 regulator [Arthrobacter sp. TE1826]BAA25925.1 negative regulator [Arthrobacter sp.]
MEIKDLQIFQKVVEYGSVSKAAKSLNYVQSYVTVRIQKLEEELQTELFHRSSRGMVLNSEGKTLLFYSQNIISMVDEMIKVVQDCDNPAGSLEIGTVETVNKLPSILSAYHKKYPKIDLSLITGVTEDLVDDVLNYKLDGAFVTGYYNHPQIIQYEVFEEELVLISNYDKLPFEELKNKPLLVFKQGCSYRAKLEGWVRDEGEINAKIMEFGTMETILGSVIAGLGITIIPKSTISLLEAEGVVRIYEIPEKYSKITTVFIHRADTFLTNALQKFIETIKNAPETARKL